MQTSNLDDIIRRICANPADAGLHVESAFPPPPKASARPRRSAKRRRREVNGELKPVWMGRGKAENIAGARAFSHALHAKGIKHVLHESDFGRSWITWRRDLY